MGTLESYAALVGILIGAGIFKVTSESWALTGPSVILAQALLLLPILATSVGYSVFLSTPLGTEPGGEYTHISRTLGGRGVAFVGAWLKIISYLGALAFLALGFADYVAELLPADARGASVRTAVALGALVLFFGVHAAGVRWFGRLQVAMVALLGFSVAVLVVPGLFAIHPAHYRPFFTHGASGFAAALPPLFFLYAGFESLAQTAGEVRDSRRRLPGIFLRGLVATALVYVLMSAVAFGVLPGERLQASPAPMAEVGAQYLHAAAAAFVTLGAVMALATSLNATMLVPSRMALVLVRDGLAPAWIGKISDRTGTPILGLALTLGVAMALVVSGQVSLALNIAVFALVALYLLHSVALLLLPRWNPELFATAEAAIPLWVQRVAGIVSIASMAGLLAIQVGADAAVLGTTTLRERAATHRLTTIELAAAWGVLGLVLYGVARRRHRRID
ncbi:MAG TPA: APC family permease [Vicinamibacteria bacterium]|nr:APC family permease [Vicinamibacteria bacterium]